MAPRLMAGCFSPGTLLLGTLYYWRYSQLVVCHLQPISLPFHDSCSRSSILSTKIAEPNPAMRCSAAPERPPLVSSEILLGTMEAARELDIDLDSTLLEHSIDRALLRTPTGYLRHSQATRFLQAVSERFHCDHFGYLVGKHQPPMQLGALGELMSAAPTLGVAIENGLLYHHSYSEGSQHDLSIEKGLACVGRWDRRSYPFGSSQMRMLGIVLVFKVLKTLAGTAWRPRMITFTFSEPEKSHQLRGFFGCPVLFDQDIEGIYFPDRDLSTPLATSNPEVLRLVKAQLDRSSAGTQLDEGIYEQARQYVRITMATQRCSIDGCAQFLNVHPRTLQRELAKHHRNFKQLLLQIRMDTARQYLSDSSLGLGAVAALLGYRNHSAFSRSFKLQHGVAPMEWREALKREQAADERPEDRMNARA